MRIFNHTEQPSCLWCEEPHLSITPAGNDVSAVSSELHAVASRFLIQVVPKADPKQFFLISNVPNPDLILTSSCEDLTEARWEDDLAYRLRLRCHETQLCTERLEDFNAVHRTLSCEGVTLLFGVGQAND